MGRRRVGKTYLIRETYKDQITFEVTGIQAGTQKEQLKNFHFSLNQYFDTPIRKNAPDSWLEAFRDLIHHLSLKSKKGKQIIFIDELPWIATPRSDFLKGLGFFWNSWASKSPIILVTCGSAASWMIEKLLLNKGGLHNRVTRQMYLQPFAVDEVRSFLLQKNISFNLYQITQLYMTLGGVPYYLKLVPRGKSVPQIVDTLLFQKNAPLGVEFENLYQALFNSYENYISVVRACYTKWKGITQNEMLRLTKLTSGGSLTRILNDLEASGFITSYHPFSKRKKETLYRLTDEFSIFHLHFLEGKRATNWINLSQLQSFKSWLGFAFENFCIKHIDAIKKKLGIEGVQTHHYSFVQKGNDKMQGTQIDLVIDRNDQIINICEIKYHQGPYLLTKAYKEKLINKTQIFRSVTNTQKTIHLTMITTYGLKSNRHSEEIVDSEVELADFFAL